MYKLRLQILVLLFVLTAGTAIVRLLHLQVSQSDQARRQIHDDQILPPRPLPTLRGKILDRCGRALAKDAPAFYLHVSYRLTRLLDDRYREGAILRRTGDRVTVEKAAETFDGYHEKNYEMLSRILEFARSLRPNRQPELMAEIATLNNRLWDRASYIYWRRSHPRSSMDDYRAEKGSIYPEDVVAIDLAEMHERYPLIELSGEELVRAQIELAGMEGVEIRPEGKRIYPYDTAACQLLGWAGPVQDFEKERFSHDAYLRYLDGELIGKAGIERICEPILRGRRGEVQYDKDGNQLSRTEPQYGRDVRLTLDIELQRQIEELLGDPAQNPNAAQGVGAVVMDSATGDILAAVSTPVFDLNRVRRDYTKLINDPNQPFLHKALQCNYPPGSTVKPLILVAGLEEQKVGPHEIVPCPPHPPAGSWPRCLIQWKLGSSHDWRWANEGGNTARNAIRGSCNIYFSRLADRLDERKLQEWLYRFGYGREILPGPRFSDAEGAAADDWGTIPQSPGSIIFGVQKQGYRSFDEVPELKERSEKRFWGIGQGNLRVTVLQVANALCTLTRGGIYKPPRLIIEEDDPNNERSRRPLGISSQTLNVVRDGMFAAVNEAGGTGYNTFHDLRGRPDPLLKELRVHGKTGSTTNPDVAWFECFAEDRAGRCIVIAVAVPGGEAGSVDAAPLGKKILQICNEMGHIGTRPSAAPMTTSAPGS